MLVLEGGGDRGAYQTGALRELVDLLPAEEVAYDVVTGISIGSINGLAFSSFEKGKEKEAVAFIESIWNKVQRKDVW